MSFNKFHNRISTKWLVSLTVTVLSAILFIGLKPKALSHSNNAGWLVNRTGIRFAKNSIAYTDPIFDLIQDHVSSQQEFSVEIALKPKSFQEEGFGFIFLIHGGRDRNQFLIGQWGASLIAMNGDDYDHHRKTKRIFFKSTSPTPDMHLMTVTTGTEGSKIYIDGRLVKSRKDLKLRIPDGKTARLLLGNSIYGRHAWNGEIYGVALYGNALSPKEIEAHSRAFFKNRRFSAINQPAPFILFPLDEKGGTLAKNYPGGTHHLHIPSEMKILSPLFFFRNQLRYMLKRSIFTNQDAILNFFGFIPLGILLSATLVRLDGAYERHAIAITLLTGFFISLFIETIQAWMPDRSSDIQDLILNTVGTLIGAVSCRYFMRIQG